MPYQTTDKQQQAMGLDESTARDKSPFYINQQNNLSSAGPLQRINSIGSKVSEKFYHQQDKPTNRLSSNDERDRGSSNYHSALDEEDQPDSTREKVVLRKEPIN